MPEEAAFRSGWQQVGDTVKALRTLLGIDPSPGGLFADEEGGPAAGGAEGLPLPGRPAGGACLLALQVFSCSYPHVCGFAGVLSWQAAAVVVVGGETTPQQSGAQLSWGARRCPSFSPSWPLFAPQPIPRSLTRATPGLRPA